MIAEVSYDWRQAWSHWLHTRFAWRSHTLASSPLDDPTASLPRAARPPGPVEQARRHDQSCDQRIPPSSGEAETGWLDFDAFFLRYQRPVYIYLRRLLPSEESATDLTQEVFFRAWTSFERLRAYQRPEAWLFRVATNLALNQLRRREPLSLSRLLRRREGEHESEDVGLFPDGASDLADAFAEREIIERSLRSLPERQRIALLLHAAHGLTADEVAEMLGISVANTYQLISRGARRFREAYDDAQREVEE